MRKYETKEANEAFLLSLSLFNENLDAKEYIKKLYAISNQIKDNYFIFKIPKKSGGTRTIYAPNYTLKYIQKQISEKLLKERYISKYAKAYYKGATLKENALVHKNKAVLLKLDIENFFENITFSHVYEEVFYIYPEKVRVLLTNLCLYDNYLPQGAPTSPYISNIIMRDFDEKIGKWCLQKKISYTRYSDDLTFSGDFEPNEVIKKVKEELFKKHFKINKKKIHVIKNHSQQRVTGVVVNKKIQDSKSYRKEIRKEMYYIKKYGIESHLEKIHSQTKPQKYLQSLSGKISYVLMINKEDKEFKRYKQEIDKMKKQKQ